MNICIITVYNSMNCGSYLQSYALMETLKKHGYNVVFLNTGIKKPNIIMFRAFLKSIMTLRFAKAKFYLRKWQGFREKQKIFRIIPGNINSISQCDLFLFGSDEIWNVGREEFAKYPILWGLGIESNKTIAYAPSINRSSLAQLKSLEYPEKCLEKFKSLMVRDEHTKTVLSYLTNKEIKVVVDPTLLLHSEEYNIVNTQVYSGNYILLYTYGKNLTYHQIEKIKHFAKEKNLKLVSSYSWFDWCDKNIGATPFDFIALIKGATYVVTDTFHGTIFSILFSKQFVSYAGDNVKVLELLKLFGLQSRIPDDSVELNSIMDVSIDHEKIKEKIQFLRNESLRMLTKAIENVNEK